MSETKYQRQFNHNKQSQIQGGLKYDFVWPRHGEVEGEKEGTGEVAFQRGFKLDKFRSHKGGKKLSALANGNYKHDFKDVDKEDFGLSSHAKFKIKDL